MNNNTLYKNCLQSLRSLNLEDLLDEPFLEFVKSNLSEIVAEPEDSSKITGQILHSLFLRLNEKFSPFMLPDKHEQVTEQHQLL